MLAVKMAYRDLDYYHYVKKLLDKGVNGLTKDTEGWSPLDEAISKSDILMTKLLFKHLMDSKRRKICHQQHKILDALRELPDFHVKLQWDMSSSIIPFFKKFAPKGKADMPHSLSELTWT